jgi:DNA-binding transcriptional regulator YhcF (GntR family)
MTFRIDLKSSVPVYRQIVDSLRIMLVNGALRPGDQLPPVRTLATDLGVHFNTVAAAYETSETFQRRVRELVAEMQARGSPRARIVRELRRLADRVEKTQRC